VLSDGAQRVDAHGRTRQPDTITQPRREAIVDKHVQRFAGALDIVEQRDKFLNSEHPGEDEANGNPGKAYGPAREPRRSTRCRE